LAYLGILTGLVVLTRYQAAALGIAIMGVLVVYLWLDHRREAYCEGTLLTYGIPLVYVALLWLISNWLIMGDALFFLRGVLRPSMADGPFREVLIDGCEWSLCLAPVAAVVAGWLFSQLPSRGRPSRRVAGTAAAFLAAAALIAIHLPWEFPEEPPSVAMTAELPDIIQYVEHTYPHSRIVASGSLGYDVMRHVRNRDGFIHTMSYYMRDILERTKGQRLYLLVPSPRGLGRWEDINLTYPGIYEHGAPFTLLERSWSRWRLYRVVRTDLPA